MARIVVWVLLALGLALPSAADETMERSGERLAAAAARYRELANRGGWQPVPDGPSLHPRESSPAVPVIRARLAVTGDLLAGGSPAQGADPQAYDDGLVDGVRSFQRRHGLATDGVIGARTRAAMNVSVQDRIAQLELNRSRVSDDEAPSERYIRVNLPEFRLVLMDGDTPVLDMPVVVGRRDRKTPFIESAVSWIVFNPTWTVPTKLAYEDLLPKVRRDPSYFSRSGIQVYESWQASARPIDSAWIEWREVGAAMKRLRLRQAPGPDNPLGRIKFHMDNDHDIYLHDTNHRELLAKDLRALSSGCIRVGNAEGLARELLRDQPSWPPERIDKALAGRETTRVALRHPVPVRFVYQTAWIDGQETVHFREDIYGVDARQVADLAAAERRSGALGDGPAPGVSPPAP
jgi:murein L,D-transpeptidase YcbB/YkuD